MPTTTQPGSVLTLTELQRFEPGRLIGSFKYETLAVWRGTPNTPVGNWYTAVDLDCDVESFTDGTAAQGLARLRLSTGATSNVALVGAPNRRLVLGWMPVPDAEFTVLLEAKRVLSSDSTSFAFHRADPALVWAPSAGLIGGPNYPTGVTPPTPVLFWSLGPGAPVGAVWTERNFETATLNLVGGPAVDANNGISLVAGTGIDGTPMTEPGDTFDVSLDITTPAVTVAGHRFFTTKTGTSNAAAGVSLRFGDTTGGVIVRYTDGTGANSVAPTVAVPVNTRMTLRVVKSATDITVYRDGAAIIVHPRDTPVAGSAGGAFTINGFPGNHTTFGGDLTVHSVTIVDGA